LGAEVTVPRLHRHVLQRRIQAEAMTALRIALFANKQKIIIRAAATRVAEVVGSPDELFKRVLRLIRDLNARLNHNLFCFLGLGVDCVDPVELCFANRAGVVHFGPCDNAVKAKFMRARVKRGYVCAAILIADWAELAGQLAI